MELITTKKKEIQDSTFQNEDETTRKRAALVSLSSFVVFVVAVGLVKDPEEVTAQRAHSTATAEFTPAPKPVATPERRPGTRINAVDLYAQYQANEVEADRRYLDRVLQVEGTIEGIRKAEDFTVLGGIKKELVVDFYVGQLGHQSLTCHFSKKNHAQLSEAVQGPVHCRGGGVQRGGIWALVGYEYIAWGIIYNLTHGPGGPIPVRLESAADTEHRMRQARASYAANHHPRRDKKTTKSRPLLPG